MNADNLGGAEQVPTTTGHVQFYLRRCLMPGDQAQTCEYLQGFIAAAKLPHPERVKAAEQVEATMRTDRGSYLWYPFSQLMTPAAKIIAVGQQHRADLLSMATLIACEGFRLTHGRWPESLAELPRELLPAIPLDPYNGEPMKFAKLADGITVYSVGAGNLTDRDKKRLTNPLGGTELGWRLYTPELRGFRPSAPTQARSRRSAVIRTARRNRPVASASSP